MAPEHLILHLENAERYKDKIINAGRSFLENILPKVLAIMQAEQITRCQHMAMRNRLAV